MERTASGLWVPFDPEKEILSPDRWPVPTRVAMPLSGLDTNSGLATPWIDNLSSQTPNINARRAAPKLGREAVVSVNYDTVNGGTITFATFDLIVETMRFEAGNPNALGTFGRLSTTDIRLFMQNDTGYQAAISVAARIFRVRLAWTSFSVTPGTAVPVIQLRIAFDQMRQRYDPKPAGERAA